MRAARVVQAVDDGERAFVVYEADTAIKRLRNCEMHLARAGKLVFVEVCFGWDLLHSATLGCFVDKEGAGHA